MSKAIKKTGVQKSRSGETDKEVSKIVDYLLEKQEIDRMLRDSFLEKADIDAELESIVSDLDRAGKRLTALYSHFQLGRLEPFLGIQKRVIASREAAMEAWVQASRARQELSVEHPPRTRTMELQQSAVRLAVAHFDQAGRGQARAYAKLILQKARLPYPEESTLTKWIKEFREVQNPSV